MLQETQLTLLDLSLNWLLLSSLTPMIQLLIAVFNSALLITESISFQPHQHVLLAALVFSITQLKDVASVKQATIQFNKPMDKVLEVLNAILALLLSVKHVFKLPLLSVKAVLMVLLPMLTETARALQDFIKMEVFAQLAQLSVLLAESEESAIPALILLPEA